MRWPMLVIVFAGCQAGTSARDFGPDLSRGPDLSFSCPNPIGGQPCFVPGAICDDPAVAGCTYSCQQGVWSSDFCEPPQPIGCMDLIACTNACTTQACLTKCHKMATAQANALNKSLDDCITMYCVTAPDGGMGPCSSTDQTACNTCVMNTQSGTSPTGMSNGTCMPANDPVCGFCVDQLIACANDLSM